MFFGLLAVVRYKVQGRYFVRSTGPTGHVWDAQTTCRSKPLSRSFLNSSWSVPERPTGTANNEPELEVPIPYIRSMYGLCEGIPPRYGNLPNEKCTHLSI